MALEDRSELTTMMKALMRGIEETNALLKKTLSKSQPLARSGADGGLSPENVLPARGDKRTKVTLRVEFLKIEDVDTKENKFTGEVLLEATWKEPGLIGKTDDELDNIESFYGEIWDPKLVILNMDHAPLTDGIWYDIEPSRDGVPVVLYRRKLKASFFERLELHHFPFDTQELSLHIISEHSAKDVLLEIDLENPSYVHIHSFRDSDEWTLFSSIHEQVREHAPVTHKKSNVPITVLDSRHTRLRKNKVTSSCFVARNYGYWVFNVFTILLLINCLTFTPFAFMATETSSRLSVMMSLLITCVATKMAIGRMLPPISYLTYLDIYVLSVMGFLGMQATQFAVSSVWVNDDLALIEQIDRYTMVGMAAILLAFNIGYVVVVFCTALSKRRRLGIANYADGWDQSYKKNDDANGNVK